jgi:YfiH family protein
METIIVTTNGNPTEPDDFELRRADGTTWVACPPLEAEGFVAAFSTREGAADGEPLADTARRLLAAVDRPDATLVTCRQVHSTSVRLVKAARDAGSAEAECDAVATAVPGLVVGVKTADCVPILIADLETRAVAAVHAGWRGTAGRIVERAFAMMIATWKTHRSDCVAAVGPAVCAACYEVGPEVLGRFRDEFPYADRVISNASGDKGHLDLKLANAIQLELCGLDRDGIFVSDYCTMCSSDLFYSYRREGARAGRILSIVGS